MANGIFSNTQSIIEYLYCYKFHSSQKATNQIALYWIHLCAVPYALSQWVKALPFCHGCVNECVLGEIAHIVVSIMASPPSHPLHNENQIINNGIFKIVSYLIGSIPEDSIDCKITIYILDTPQFNPAKSIECERLSRYQDDTVIAPLLFQLLALYSLSQTLDIHGSSRCLAVKMHPGWFNQHESHQKTYFHEWIDHTKKNQSSFMGPSLFDELKKKRAVFGFFNIFLSFGIKKMRIIS